MLDFKKTIPLSLYIHYPWCVKKCPYCDFNSHAVGASPIKDVVYVDALRRDLEMELSRIWGRRLHSVFIGGGTPSLLTGSGIEQLMSVLRSHLNLQANIEVTMEANPGTVDSARFRTFRESGVNRLSIVVQSFNEKKLKTLGRIHSSEDADLAFITARNAGFENINIDLMFALPGQTLSEALDDLKAAIKLQPEHISWYQLTIEPNTIFYSQPPELPDDDLCWKIQESGKELLESHGYRQYEISAYARGVELRSQHNLNYWSFGDYLAVGAGAHGKISTAQSIGRYAKPANPLQYMQSLEEAAPDTELTKLNERERMFEFMLNALRLTDGFDQDLFQRRTGLAAETLLKKLTASEEKGLIEEVSSGFWRVTNLGQRFLNDLQAEFLP
jgi:oxygen-independent coproporphyrinogen-3 oxidase